MEDGSEAEGGGPGAPASAVEEGTVSLPELYDAAVKLQSEISGLTTASAEFKSKNKEAQAHLKAAADMCRQLSMFSDGESFTEHSTASLRYLLIPAYQADLQSKVYPDVDDPERDLKRIASLEASRALLVQFLEDCLKLGMGSEEKINVYIEQKPNERMSRDVKVEGRRAEMAASKKVQELADALAAVKKGSGVVDEELERNHLLMTLQLWNHKACLLLETLLGEQTMLQMMQQRSRAGPSETAASARGGGGGGSVARERDDIRTKPKKPVVITKEMVNEMMLSQTGISRADFNLVTRGYGPIGAPTMSLDQLADMEMAQAAEASRRTAEAEAARPPDDDSEAAADRATYKAREWDEFKDHTRRGDGNKLGMG